MAISPASIRSGRILGRWTRTLTPRSPSDPSAECSRRPTRRPSSTSSTAAPTPAPGGPAAPRGPLQQPPGRLAPAPREGWPRGPGSPPGAPAGGPAGGRERAPARTGGATGSAARAGREGDRRPGKRLGALAGALPRERRSEGRAMIASAVSELAPVVGTSAACAALAVSRATHYRRRLGPRHGPPAPRPTPARALSPAERAAALETLHADRFVDSAPAEVVATLLDEGTYLASERTMYRILAARGRGPRAPRPAAPPGLRRTRAAGHPSQRAVVLGHHRSCGARRRGRATSCT